MRKSEINFTVGKARSVTNRIKVYFNAKSKTMVMRDQGHLARCAFDKSAQEHSFAFPRLF